MHSKISPDSVGPIPDCFYSHLPGFPSLSALWDVPELSSPAGDLLDPHLPRLSPELSWPVLYTLMLWPPWKPMLIFHPMETSFNVYLCVCTSPSTLKRPLNYSCHLEFQLINHCPHQTLGSFLHNPAHKEATKFSELGGGGHLFQMYSILPNIGEFP